MLLRAQRAPRGSRRPQVPHSRRCRGALFGGLGLLMRLGKTGRGCVRAAFGGLLLGALAVLTAFAAIPVAAVAVAAAALARLALFVALAVGRGGDHIAGFVEQRCCCGSVGVEAHRAFGGGVLAFGAFRAVCTAAVATAAVAVAAFTAAFTAFAAVSTRLTVALAFAVLGCAFLACFAGVTAHGGCHGGLVGQCEVLLDGVALDAFTALTTFAAAFTAALAAFTAVAAAFAAFTVGGVAARLVGCALGAGFTGRTLLAAFGIALTAFAAAAFTAFTTAFGAGLRYGLRRRGPRHVLRCGRGHRAGRHGRRVRHHGRTLAALAAAAFSATAVTPAFAALVFFTSWRQVPEPVLRRRRTGP